MAKQVKPRRPLSKVFKSLARTNHPSVKLNHEALTHPDCNTHRLVVFLTGRRIYDLFHREYVLAGWWWACSAFLEAIARDDRFRSQLTIEDTMRALTAEMRGRDDDLYTHLAGLLSGLTLRKQFALFDRLMKLSRKWRHDRIVYQVAVVYLVQHFNVPKNKRGARSLVKMATPVLGPAIGKHSYIDVSQLQALPDEVLISLRRTVAKLAK